MIKSKSKIFLVILVLTIIISVLCLNAKAYAIEPRVAEGNEVEPISQEGGELGEEQTVPNSEEEIDPNTEGNGITNLAEANIQVHEGDLYVFYNDSNYTSTSYTMDKYVDGNVFIFGQNVTITGQINGSLFVFAQNVTIDENAYIGTHAFIAAGNITMNGFTYDMYAVCEKFEMTQNGVIYRDLKLGAEDAILRGNVGRNVDMVASKIDVFENEDNSLYVAGNFKYTSGIEIEDINKITVDGEVTFKKEIQKKDTAGSKALKYIYNAIENIIFAFIIYACFMFLAPKFIGKSKEYISVRGLLTLPIGLGFVILVPIISLLLMVISLGAGLSLTLLIIYFVIIMINSVIVTIALNEFIASKFEWANSTWKKLLMIIPVSLGIFLIRQIPVIGRWITALILFAGTGTSVLYQFDKRRKETKEIVS